jgi:hypothetical protein
MISRHTRKRSLDRLLDVVVRKGRYIQLPRVAAGQGQGPRVRAGMSLEGRVRAQMSGPQVRAGLNLEARP